MQSSGFQLAKRSLQFVRPYRSTLAGVISLALLLAALSAVDPLLMKYLFDALERRSGLSSLGMIMAGLVALELARAGLQAWLGVLSWDVRLGVDYTMRENVMSKLNSLPMSFHQGETIGATMNRINQGIAGCVTAFCETAFNLFPTLLYLVLSVTAMLQMEWRLAIAVIVFAPLPAIIGAWAAPEQMHRERRLVERWNSIYGRFNEVLAGMMTVKGFAMEEEEKRRFMQGVREGNEVVRRGVRTDNVTGTLRTLAATAARLTALAVGGYLISRQEMTVGTLLAFLGYIGGLFGPVQGLTNTYQTLRKATVSLEAIFSILDAEDVVADGPGASDVRPLRGEVEFRQVSFGYQPGSAVLRDISLTAKPGETIALIGPSGSGKTTLLALLQRFYSLTDGSITVDGVDIKRMTQRSLRSQIGVVFQDAHLFNDTVRANIAYGRPAAAQADVEAAARAAHAHDFIMALPEGYDTVVRERGSRLSGGQRQRIAIARALLKDPPILILDEATSALDSESEYLIQRALKTLLSGRTAFVIAHRLSTVRDADRIVVIKEGVIAEAGNHTELLAHGGYYASLVARQARGFLGESTRAA
ncbi:MAG TPA: ABC transporter ATP-binding protein [Gemmatimonadales bacterium]|jgi:ATP-binding cassette, subfamily B, bacterial|nr:ABC transporter ATP-binding protein [Gemmatimonadales bacterium]